MLTLENMKMRELNFDSKLKVAIKNIRYKHEYIKFPGEGVILKAGTFTESGG
jgi:hypothetical protein